MEEGVNIGLLDLPDEIIHHVFSFLNEEERANISRVSRRFYRIASDKLYWKHKLLNDIGVWNVSKTNNREDFEEYLYILRNNELTIKAVIWDPNILNKTLFTVCSPKVNYKRRHSNFMKSIQPPSTIFSKFSSLFRIPQSEPKENPGCIMFGPGLETPGLSCIARKIVNSHCNTFEAIGMKNDAITVKYEGELLDVFLLYSNVKSLRIPLSVHERLTHNKLFMKTAETWQLIDPVKHACKISNALVYVIDGNAEIENVDDPYPDLTLILNYKLQTVRNRFQNAAKNDLESCLCLLVLALVPEKVSPRQDIQHIIESLNLWKYNIRWQICLAAADLTNLSLGFDWMMAHLRSASKLLKVKE